MNPSTPPAAAAAELARLIHTRRSVDRYLAEPPPRPLLIEAIELARWAPNHRCTEPWHFYLCGSQTRQAIIDLNSEMVSARQGEAVGAVKRNRWSQVPGFLVVTCDNSDDTLRAHEDYAASACAVQNLMLALWSRGIASKWTTGAVTRDERFYELIWVDPAQETVVGLIWYGYPAHLPESTRKPVEAITVDLA